MQRKSRHSIPPPSPGDSVHIGCIGVIFPNFYSSWYNTHMRARAHTHTLTLVVIHANTHTSHVGLFEEWQKCLFLDILRVPLFHHIWTSSFFLITHNVLYPWYRFAIIHLTVSSWWTFKLFPVFWCCKQGSLQACIIYVFISSALSS